MTFGLLSNLIALFVAQTLVSGQENQDIWADAELADGELQEEECDVSFLQASLHSSLDVSHENRHRARRGHPRTKLNKVQEPLSFFQTDEEIHESAADTVTIESSESTAPASEEFSRNEDEGSQFAPERLAIAMFAFKFLAVSAVVFNGGSCFIRLLYRNRPARKSETLCDSSEPVETETQPVKQKCKLSGVLEQIAEVPMARAEDIETLLPTRDSAYDCTLSKPKQMGQALRFRARIYGPVRSSDSLVGPVTQEPCVLYQATARRTTEAGGDGSVIGKRCESIDFIAKVENYPDLALTIRGEEVQMLAMESGYCKKAMTLSAASSSCLAIVPHGERMLPDDAEIDFEESALRIGEVVTFVGDLHRDAFGSLLLWPAPWTSGSAHDQSVAEITMAISEHEHVIASDNRLLEVSQDTSFSGDHFALV
eukprot:TRINITY_DN88449_c0_g1_i1.p1 TRINITY_DN88449_c0_g1~~TRINITY_DN88449_c0_g1_i1.p1  ORF type:complete len:426 (-),score=65.82 TRINITY_DN88449_c0_g1_i1:233-1510(-)